MFAIRGERGGESKKSTFLDLLRLWRESPVICRLPSRQRYSSLELSLEYEKKPGRLFHQKLTFKVCPNISAAEISKLAAHGTIQKYVLGFNIPMYHSRSMKILDGIDQLSSVVFCTSKRYGSLNLFDQNLQVTVDCQI